MTTVLRPLGEVLCKMPVGGSDLPLKSAGPGFGYNRDVRLLPHQRSAWVFFGERLWELATIATRLRLQAAVPAEIEEAAAALQDLAGQFAPAEGRHSAPVQVDDLKAMEAGKGCRIQCIPNGPYVVTNVEHLENSKGEEIPAPDGALPVGRLGEQAVLRRNACAHRVQ
jgi:hypothetical protein